MDNFSDILGEISKMAYKIEYEENFNLAKTVMRYDSHDAKIFAQGAAFEQLNLDQNAVLHKKNKEMRTRILERFKLLKGRVEIKDQLDKLTDMFNSISV
jgi:hypothetical protein